jgi:hypothetical protein
MLIDRMVSLVERSCQGTFAQARSCRRASELSLGTLSSYGRRTLSRAICAVGRHHQDWSADYKVFSRSPWDADRLFDPVMEEYLRRYPTGPISVAFDDTKLGKTGRSIQSAFWQRDPLSPPFHVNLVYGLRFMGASLIFPHYRQGDVPPRAMPVRFVECPAVKKPGKRADEAQRRAYKEAVKLHNLSRDGLGVMRGIRHSLDQIGSGDRVMVAVVDGSLCNRTIFKADLEGVKVVARCRKDARLCFPAPEGSRRVYAVERFTPEGVRQDQTIAWRRTRVHFGGAWRRVRYKQLKGVLWRRGCGRKQLRLLVIAPQPYRVSPHARTYYRQPAYLLTTDNHTSATLLIQAYFDRWQIEVNHREIKDTLGVGQAQVWSARSVPRQPAFAVASYSLLLLAGLLEFGPGRTHHFLPLPKWRKYAKRPSALDLITLLRKEINETSVSDHLRATIARHSISYAYT